MPPVRARCINRSSYSTLCYTTFFNKLPDERKRQQGIPDIDLDLFNHAAMSSLSKSSGPTLMATTSCPHQRANSPLPHSAARRTNCTHSVVPVTLPKTLLATLQAEELICSITICSQRRLGLATGLGSRDDGQTNSLALPSLH